MKKLLISVVLLVGCILYPTTVYAGEINDAEQKIVDLMDATFLVGDFYYKIAEKYVDKVINYLSRDNVDMSESEVNDYIKQFYANLKYGISEGYLVKVGEKEKPEKEDKKPDKEDKKPDKEDKKPNKEDKKPEKEDKKPNEEQSREEINNEEETVSSVPGSQEVFDTGGMIENIVTSNGETITFYTENKDAESPPKQKNEMSSSNEMVPDMDDQPAADEIAEGHNDGEYDEDPKNVEVASEEVIPEKTGLLKNEDGGAEINVAAASSEKAGKDYSNAAPLEKNLNIGVIALIIAVIVLMICIVIVFRYKSKDRKN